MRRALAPLALLAALSLAGSASADRPAGELPVPPPSDAVSPPSPPALEPAASERPSVQLTSFQLNYLGVFQSGSSHSGQAAWTPFFEIGSVELRGELGVALLKNVLTDRFLAFNYELFARIPLSSTITWEIGGGLQTWTAGNGGTRPVLSTLFAYSVDAGIVDRIFLGYSRAFFTSGANELRLGFGLIL